MKHFVKGYELKAGSWSLVDQGVVSLGNFLTQMLLARHLSWSDYGFFALVYGVLFFLVSSFGSMVTYPLSVKGASVDLGGLRRLVGGSLWFNLGLVLPAALIIFTATAALHRPDLFVLSLLAFVFWQLQETLRRALMAHLLHRNALWGDGLSYLGQALMIEVLLRMGALTLKSTFLAIAVTSAAAALFQALQVKPRSGGFGELRASAVEYWRLGGWASATNLLNGATQQAFPWALGLLSGASAAGSFQAVVNPLKLFNPLIAGMQNLIVPAASKSHHKRGIREASRSGLGYAALGALLFLPYLVVLVVWPHAVLSLLYGVHSPYSRLELGLRICALAYAFGYWAEIVSSLLNGLGLPRSGFLAQLAATGAAAGIGVFLTTRDGLVGALASLGLCALVKAGIALYAVSVAARGGKAGGVAAGPMISESQMETGTPR
jgi:O-antigen/teichoic acid export membrane protein